MKRAPAVFYALFFLAAAVAFPQGSYLKKGQHGLGLSGTYATSNGASGFSGTAGVALGGLFDLTLSVGRATYESTEFIDLEGTSLVPELRGHVIKQNSSKSPVSLSISVGFARDDFSSPDLDAASLVMWAKSLLVGATVYRDVPISGKAYIQPYAGLGYTSSSFKFRDETTDLTLKSTGDVFSFSFGVPLVYGLSDRALFVVQPGLILNEDATTFAITAGLVYVFSKAGS